jgi:pimeloyl-ACP methyl ester carboxylesterase
MPATDLVVVLPGIMGSTLRRGNRVVWGPSAGATLHAITTLGKSIKRLELPPDIADQHPDDGVQPVSLMPDLHLLPGIWTPVKGYDVLLDRLRALGYRERDSHPDAPSGNLLPIAYDWRLSNRYTAQSIKPTVESALERWRAQGRPYADAQLVFVCHSMGGLVARWYIEKCGGAEITRKLITLGTPYRGAAKALDQLVNGVHRGIGPLSVDLTAFARSLPSLHQLLPEYACIKQARDLKKTTETTIPTLDVTKVADAMHFHTDLAEAEAARADSLAMTHAIVGFNQTTTTTASIAGDVIVPEPSYGKENLFGDATVPIVAACRSDVPMDSNTLRRVPDKHGNLQRNKAALDELEGILTANPIVVRAQGAVELRVDIPELVVAGAETLVSITLGERTRTSLLVTATHESGQAETRLVKLANGAVHATFDWRRPGAYTIDVTGVDAVANVAPVSSDLLVWDPTAQ